MHLLAALKPVHPIGQECVQHGSARTTSAVRRADVSRAMLACLESRHVGWGIPAPASWIRCRTNGSFTSLPRTQLTHRARASPCIHRAITHTHTHTRIKRTRATHLHTHAHHMHQVCVSSARAHAAAALARSHPSSAPKREPSSSPPPSLSELESSSDAMNSSSEWVASSLSDLGLSLPCQE